MRTHSMGPGTALLLLLSTGLFVSFDAIAQTTSQPESWINLDVDDPRPLLAAVQALEKRFGWTVTYEDPPYASPDDFEDVTLSTRRTLYDKTKPRTLVPRGGPFAFRHAMSAPPSSARDRQVVLETLLEQYRMTDYPGEFALTSTGDVLHVVPIGSKNPAGQRVPARSLLDLNISLPNGQRTAFDMLRAITEAVTRPGVAEVTVGTVPINLLMQVRVQDGATNESARGVLLRLLEATRQNLSWALLCDPGALRQCSVNIYPVKKESAAGR